MKKVTSLFMAGLITFLSYGVNYNVKGYQVENLPDGNKKIIYKYNELDDLIQKLEDVKNSEHKKVEVSKKLVNASIYALTPSLIAGKLLSGNGIENLNKKTDKNKKSAIAKIVSGAGLAVWGIASVVGSMMYLEYATDKNEEQCFHAEIQKYAIETIKKTLKSYVSNGQVTKDYIEKNFYYAIYVDKKGVAYQAEHAEVIGDLFIGANHLLCKKQDAVQEEHNAVLLYYNIVNLKDSNRKFRFDV